MTRVLALRRKGFTLIETLTALMIFSVAVVAMIQAVTIQIRAEQLSEDTTRAVMLAQNVIEEFKHDRTYERSEDTGSFQGSNAAFAWKYELEETDVPGLWKLTVTIEWGPGTEKQSYIAQTYLADR